MIVRFFLFFLLSLFFSSCQPYVSRGKMLPLSCTDLERQVEKAEDTQVFCTGELPSESWWGLFGDPSLNQLVESALCCHPDMKIAEARINLAYATAMQSRSRLLPHLFFVADVTSEKSSLLTVEPPIVPNFTQPTLSFNALYEVDLWNKNRALYFADLDATYAAVADRANAKLVISIAVAQSYFHLQMHTQQLSIIKEQIRIKQEQQKLYKERFYNGIISELYLYEVDSEIAEFEEKRETYEGLIEIDKQTLSALSGNSCCQEICFNELNLCAFLQERFVLPCSLPFDLLARRPDVIAKRWLIEQGRFLIHAARARFYPSLDLFSYIGVQSFHIGQLFTDRAIMALGEATGILPIFTAGKLKAQLIQEEEKYEIAIQEYNQTVLTAVQQASAGITNLITQDRRKKQAQRIVQDNQALYELTALKFRSGTTNLLALLKTEEDLLLQKELLIQVELQRYESALALIKAIGGGYDVRRRNE